jgi:hypothetical protein
MNGFSLLLAVASLNVTYSWRTGLDQQEEYLLQIEPEIVQALAAGEEIYSDIPANVGPLARLCIAVLAKDGTPVRHVAAGEEQFRQLLAGAGRYASLDRTSVKPDLPPILLWPGRAPNPEQTYGVTIGWQPDKNGAQQYLVQIDPTVLSRLTLGDELYVPIDPAAGKPVRFVVKAGRGNLPKVGGLATAPRYDTANTNSPPPAHGNRFGGLNDTTNQTNQWDSTRYSDTGRQLPRTVPGTDPAYTVPGQLPPPPTYGATQPATYPTGAQSPATGGYIDPYRNAPPQYPSNHATYPVSSQQPQLPPGQPQFQPQYPESRVAAMTPTATTVAPSIPSAGFSVNNTGLSPNGKLQPQADKPWGPLLFVTFALFFSIGGNLYLAYTALEFHSRYRSAIERLRAAARSA